MYQLTHRQLDVIICALYDADDYLTEHPELGSDADRDRYQVLRATLERISDQRALSPAATR